MTSLLTPGYSLVLGQQRWTRQVVRIEVTLAAAPMLNRLTVWLPASAQLQASPGDPASISLNSGEHDATIFTGAIDLVQRGLDTIRLTALDAGGQLARYRPCVTYEQVKAGAVIRDLASAAGVTAGDVADGVSLLYYAADPARTALDHVFRLCAWSGFMGRVSAENRLDCNVVNATQADVALKYGREIRAFDSSKVIAPVTSFVVAGESGVGDTASPDAFRPSTDFFAGNRPAGPSQTVLWRFEPALRTASAAGTAGAALQREYTSTRERGRLRAFLVPVLRPGTILEVQSLPDGLPSGPVWVHSVQHVIDERGTTTRAEFSKGGDSFNPSQLLGALAGAVGGLL
jgi:hypothetical protein